MFILQSSGRAFFDTELIFAFRYLWIVVRCRIGQIHHTSSIHLKEKLVPSHGIFSGKDLYYLIEVVDRYY